MPSILPDSKSSIVAFQKWLADIPVSYTTGWRWVKRGWIRPVNIAGRLYLTEEEIEVFQTRACHGEFAKAATGAAGAARSVKESRNAQTERTA